MAYMIYVVSPTELIFGNKQPNVDLSIVFAFVILSIKNLISNAITSLPNLIATANEYIVYSASNATTGIQFTLTQAELNGYVLGGFMPKTAQIGG